LGIEREKGIKNFVKGGGGERKKVVEPEMGGKRGKFVAPERGGENLTKTKKEKREA